MANKINLIDQLHFTEVTFSILFSLAGGSKHGYAIMKDVHQLSRERICLSTGTLYMAIKRLLEIGWITQGQPAVQKHDGRLRKSYQLTRLGCQVLLAEASRLNNLVTTAHKQILHLRKNEASGF